MIVAIDVKDLVTLHTKDTAAVKYNKKMCNNQIQQAREPTQTTHTRSGLEESVSIDLGGIEWRGSNIPVPRTTTSYSGAISSMMNVDRGILEVKDDWNKRSKRMRRREG
jgi:hypothetical protein